MENKIHTIEDYAFTTLDNIENMYVYKKKIAA